MSGLKGRILSKFDTVMGRSKSVSDDDVYGKLEKECESIRKAGTTLKKNLHRYVESKPSLKERLLNDAKQENTESLISNKIALICQPLNGITYQYANVAIDTFKELSQLRNDLEKFFMDGTKVEFENHFENSYLEVKRTTKNVNSARAIAIAAKNNKKATQELILGTQFNYELEKTKRQNIMLDYSDNDHVARIDSLMQLYEKLVAYHLECSDLFSKHLQHLARIKKDAVDAGLKSHFPLPDSDNFVSVKDAAISFSDEGSVGRSSIQSGSLVNSSLTAINEADNSHNHNIASLSRSSTNNNSVNNSATTPTSQNNPFLEIDKEASAIVDKSAEQTSSSNNLYTPEPKKYAIVHFDFEAECEDELTVNAGSEVVVVKTVDENWILAEQGGKRGFIPVTYIQLKK